MGKAEKTFRELYPALSEDEVNEAEFNTGHYLEVVLKIGERLAAEKRATRDDHPLS